MTIRRAWLLSLLCILALSVPSSVLPQVFIPGVPLLTIFNVKWYGAKCDGSTDDTTAINAAKVAAVANGGVLYFPPGTCRGSLALLATDDNLTIDGSGWERSILEAKNNSTATIYLPPGTHYITIKNLSIRNTSGGNNGTHYGIHSAGDGAGNGASYLHMQNVRVQDYNINIRLDEMNGHTLEDVWAVGAVTGAGAPPIGANIYAGHPTNHSVGVWYRNVHTAGGKYGFYHETVEGTVMSDSESLVATANGFIHTTSGTAVTGLAISNSQFDSSGGVAVSLYRVNNGQFSNVWVSTGTNDGITLEESDHNVFVNLQAFGNSGVGIHLLTGSQKNVFTGSQSISNGGDGIRVENGAWGNMFAGTVTWNNTGIGINFLDVTAGEPNQVIGFYSVGNAGGSRIVQTKDKYFGHIGNPGHSTSEVLFEGTTLANLGAPPDGTVQYCSNCTFANPCAAAGTGAIAKRLNGAWRCD